MELFKNLKVIELANVLAGPSVGTFFAELGARVIKVENKLVGGDMTRKWKVPSEDATSPVSAYYSSVNYRKEIEFLDLNNKEDHTNLIEWIKEADILISNYKPGDDIKFSVDYDSLKSVNPGLIYGHLTGFGDDSNRVAYDIVLQAEAGFMYMNGEPERPPSKIPIALIDIAAAHQLKEGILVALIKRQQTSLGSYVKCNLYDSAIATLANQASNWLMAGHIPEPMGSLHPNIAPYGEIISTRDGAFVVLAVGSDKQFKALCEVLEDNNLSNDPKFKSNELRVINRDELKERIEPLFRKFDLDQLMPQLEKRKVPVGEIKNMKQVFASGRAAELILEEEIEGVTTKRPRTVVFEIE